jgi:hypothetical protein
MPFKLVALFTDMGELRAEVFGEEELETIPDSLKDMAEDAEHLQVIRVKVPDPREKVTVKPAISFYVTLGE